MRALPRLLIKPVYPSEIMLAERDGADSRSLSRIHFLRKDVWVASFSAKSTRLRIVRLAG